MAAVHEDAFTLLSGGDALSEYNQNTGIPALLLGPLRDHPLPQEAGDTGPFRVKFHCSTGFDASTPAVRQAEGCGISVRESAARDLWTGPREA